MTAHNLGIRFSSLFITGLIVHVIIKALNKTSNISTEYKASASDIKGTAAGNYVVNWKVVDTNNVTIKDGTINYPY